MQDSGILLIDKPSGMTSFDCLRVLKRSWKRADIGHGGTLDRFATGVLPVLTGEALKLARFFLEHHPTLPTYWKRYEGVFQLGVSTDTGDHEGAETARQPLPQLDLAQIQNAFDSFTQGVYMQTPPVFSAKKLSGKRASDLVRAGETVVLEAVPVEIRSFTAQSYDSATGELRFEALCSKGTYVRQLAVDASLKLGTVAHLKVLRRTAVGSFTIGQTVSLESACADAGLGLNLEAAIHGILPTFPILSPEREELHLGRTQNVATRLSNSGLPASVYCATIDGGIPVAFFELNQDKHARFLRGFQSK